MGDETVNIVKLSELVGSSRPVTGAYSIISSPSVSVSESTRNFGARNGPDRGSHPGTAIPDPKVLKSLKAPVLLTGTLTLPPHNDDSASERNCFKFSDGSATICCDILQFDLKIIGQRIRILAWNFIPLRRNGGFLEIIRWDFLEPSSVLSSFSLFSGSSTNCTDLAKARPCLTGAVESVSPVSVVPCISSSTGESNASRSLRGFLVKMLVLEESLMRLSYLQDQFIQVQKTDIRGNGECGSYSGIVTGIYMQGMIVELDQEVMLMLTDNDITVPHGLRVGAIMLYQVPTSEPFEVLLLIASFKRKFNGILSMKEILGSKNKEGLAQLYARSRLPVSAFFPQERDYDIMGWKDQCNSISCGSRDHVQLIRRAVHSDEIGIALVGCLKISESSGRLQLVDATGSIDVIPDISLNWNVNRLYEVKKFTLSMEGIPKKMDHMNLLQNEPFTCRHIFTSGPSIREINMSLHLSYNVADKISIDHPVSDCINMKETFQELESGKFHLLWIKHKFPILQKYQHHQGISSKSSVFAEALVLPWDLHIAENNGDALSAPFSDLLKDSMECLSRSLPPCKKGKIGHPSNGGKVFLNSRNHIWSLSFSTDEILQNSNSSSIFPQGSSIVNDDEVSPEGYHQQQIPPSKH
nr:CST complex subunit CTC1 isoform X2 [Ipomoea batatas]